MQNPLQLGEEVRADVIRRYGTDVVFVAGDGTRIPLKAQIGGPQPQASQNGAGQHSLPATSVITTDFLVVTEDLNTQEITRGCRIEFGDRIYQPASPHGEPLDRDSGRFGIITRIHTVQVQ